MADRSKYSGPLSESQPHWVNFEDPVERDGFTQIPNAFLRSPRLSMQAKYLYTLLKSYAWQDPTAHPGIKRLCNDANTNDRTLAKYLKELVEAGLLEINRRGLGKTNVYTFKSLSRWLAPDTYPESYTGTKQESYTGTKNKDTGNEYSVNTSGRDAGASREPLRGERKQNWFDVYCHLATLVGLPISPEDRQRLPGNLLRCATKEGASEHEMYQLINRRITRALEGWSLSPQEVLKDVRGGPRNRNGRGSPSRDPGRVREVVL